MNDTIISKVLVIGLFSLALSSFASAPQYEEPFTRLLQTYVNESGQVNYTALKSNREELDAIITGIQNISADEFDEWNEDAQIAYLINAYNVFTLQVIVDHYPIQSNWKARLLGHPNGIRHIPGVWDDFTWEPVGNPKSLNDIEHEILRKAYNRPAIHMGLVCASTSCPKLRREAFTGEKLKDQLRDQTKRFLSDPGNLQLSANPPVAKLSSIFKWFGEDFPRRYGVPPEFAHLSEKEAGIFAFIAEHGDDQQRDILASEGIDIEYLDYDWSLNDIEN